MGHIPQTVHQFCCLSLNLVQHLNVFCIFTFFWGLKALKTLRAALDRLTLLRGGNSTHPHLSCGWFTLGDTVRTRHCNPALQPPWGSPQQCLYHVYQHEDVVLDMLLTLEAHHWVIYSQQFLTLLQLLQQVGGLAQPLKFLFLDNSGVMHCTDEPLTQVPELYKDKLTGNSKQLWGSIGVSRDTDVKYRKFVTLPLEKTWLGEDEMF